MMAIEDVASSDKGPDYTQNPLLSNNIDVEKAQSFRESDTDSKGLHDTAGINNKSENPLTMT